jgi:hypothetical protein
VPRAVDGGDAAASHDGFPRLPRVQAHVELCRRRDAGAPKHPDRSPAAVVRRGIVNRPGRRSIPARSQASRSAQHSCERRAQPVRDVVAQVPVGRTARDASEPHPGRRPGRRATGRRGSRAARTAGRAQVRGRLSRAEPRRRVDGAWIVANSSTDDVTVAAATATALMRSSTSAMMRRSRASVALKALSEPPQHKMCPEAQSRIGTSACQLMAGFTPEMKCVSVSLTVPLRTSLAFGANRAKTSNPQNRSADCGG